MKVNGITPEQFESLFEWVSVAGGEAIQGNPIKFRVRRDSTDRVEVKIKAKAGGEIAHKMNVWVVWASTQGVKYGPGSPLYQDRAGGGFITGAIGYLHTVLPTTIFTDSERPNLNGTPLIPVPGEYKWDARTLSGGATKRWDATRKVSGSLTLPASVPQQAVSQPVPPAQITFPSADLEGNDDAEVSDESNDPYRSISASASRPAVPIDGLLSVDSPRIGISHLAGSDGEKASWVLHFKEFMRLEIAGKWFRISDDTEWHIKLRLKKIAGKWINHNTSQGPGAA